MRSDAVPDLILGAGEQAVEQYHAYFDEVIRNPNTRSSYRSVVRRFFCWAKQRGLCLAAISSSDAVEFVRQACPPATESGTSSLYLTMIRSLFRHFARTGVVATNLLETPHSCKMAAAAERRARIPLSELEEMVLKLAEYDGAPGVDDRTFPLLSVMAMLANMEVMSLKTILDEDWAAESLLEFVRWRDGRHCTQCGAMAEEQTDDTEREGNGHRCKTCGEVYAVTNESPFEDSPLPLRHGLFLLLELYLRDGPPPETESLAQRLGIDVAYATELASRFQKALARDGLEAGEALRQAVARKDREMTQDEVIRDIMHYRELEAVQDELIVARRGP
jgi:transposase-like protein